MKNGTKGVECELCRSSKETKMKEVHLLLLFLRLGRQSRDYAIITGWEIGHAPTDEGEGKGIQRRTGSFLWLAVMEIPRARYARGLG